MHRANLIDKNGGLNNASAYMGMMPARRLGIVVLSNRGGIDVAQAGRRALRQLSKGMRRRIEAPVPIVAPWRPHR